MSKNSQQDIVDAYLLHRECVRRNAEYTEAYRQVSALTHPAHQEHELVRLAERWGLALTDDLPDPSARPGYDPKLLRAEANLSLATLLDGPMQTDPIEMDAALMAQEHLATVGTALSQELKGFLVLLHCPETLDRPWGFDVIDLRRPKEEIMAGVQHLIDEAREQQEPRAGKLRGPSGSEPKAKGFDYLQVYDLKQHGKSLKWIAYEMWGPYASHTKASRYFTRAQAMIKTPFLLRRVSVHLGKRRQKRPIAQSQSLPSKPLLWGKRAWLRAAPLVRRRAA